jgi:carotenoid 1,2-hydratase
MTERGRAASAPGPETFHIGPSALAWDGNALTVQINEFTVPLPTRLRGAVRVIPHALTGLELALDPAGDHLWRPIAPCARVEVEFEQPALRWSGEGYLDSNHGDGPLEDAFACWDWSRASVTDGTSVLYRATPREADDVSFALRFDRSGDMTDFESPPRVALAPTQWRLTRFSAADDGGVRIVSTLEDAPFYARSLLATRLQGRDAMAIHETLSLDRFRAGWVRALLPFRMPRRAR